MIKRTLIWQWISALVINHYFGSANLLLKSACFLFLKFPKAIYFLTSTFKNRFLTHLSWTNLHVFFCNLLSEFFLFNLFWSHDPHSPLEYATIFIPYWEVFFIFTFAQKLKLIASTSIFIILKILELSPMSSKTDENLWKKEWKKINE